MKSKNIFRPPETLLVNTTRTLILVDWSNLMYRAWFSSREEPWIAYCKFFDMLRLCVKRSKQPGVPMGLIFCGESYTRLKRKELYPEYKGQRKYSQNEDFAKYQKNLKTLVEQLGYKVLSYDGSEADDIIASIVATTCHRCRCLVKCEDCHCADAYTTDIVIFSGDGDLQQLLAWDRTLIYRAPGIFVDKAFFEDKYGIPVEKYGIYKALIGDASDNIKGVEGFGPVKAQIAIKANTVAEDIYEIGAKASEQFRLAYKLVMLDTGLKINLDDIYTSVPKDRDLDGIDKRILLEIKRFGEEFG